MKQSFLKVRQLSQSYNGHEVFSDFKFSVSTGASILLQGKNGSGKTTILKILCGLLEPTAGKFSFENQTDIDHNKVKYKLRELSIYLHQQPFLFDTSVKNNLAYATNSTSALSEQDQQKLFDQLRLHNLVTQNTSNLSIGQKQLVALARSLIFNPRLLLLDEPFTAMDKESFSSTVQALEGYKSAGGTILLVSHQHDRDFDLIDTCWCIHPAGALYCV